MLDSFKNLLKKPEFPDSPAPSEIDFLDKQQQNANEPFLVENEEEEGEENTERKGRDETKQEKKTGAWVRTAAGLAACIGGACLGFYWFGLSHEPLSTPMIKCKKTPNKKCRYSAGRRNVW